MENNNLVLDFTSRGISSVVYRLSDPATPRHLGARGLPKIRATCPPIEVGVILSATPTYSTAVAGTQSNHVVSVSPIGFGLAGELGTLEFVSNVARHTI